MTTTLELDERPGREERRNLLLRSRYGSIDDVNEEEENNDEEEQRRGGGGEEEEEEGTQDDDDFDDDEEGDGGGIAAKSFHLGKTKVSHANVWTSMRFTESFADYGDEYDKVPSLLKENVALVLDPNLDPREKGKLYYAENAFYKMNQDPHYALTVNCDIYQRILKEVNDSRTVPCGVYFCCHGGDGAHTGVSSDDFVDIKLAWMFVSALFLGMIALSVM